MSYILYIHVFFSLFWFFKFPTYRYGAAYLGTSVILIYLIILNKFKYNIYFDKISKFFLLFIFVIVLSKNFDRINDNFQKPYIDYPWPKKNSFTEKNEKNVNNPVIFKNSIIYYESSPYSLCMYSKAPCTSLKNLKMERIILPGNYKVFIPYIK